VQKRLRDDAATTFHWINSYRRNTVRKYTKRSHSPQPAGKCRAPSTSGGELILNYPRSGPKGAEQPGQRRATGDVFSDCQRDTTAVGPSMLIKRLPRFKEGLSRTWTGSRENAQGFTTGRYGAGLRRTGRSIEIWTEASSALFDNRDTGGRRTLRLMQKLVMAQPSNRRSQP